MFIFFSLAPAVSAAAVSRPLASQGLHQDVIQKFKWAPVLEQRWCSHADKLYLQHRGWGKPLSRPFFLMGEISSVWTSRVFSACFLKIWAWLPTLWWRWLWQVVPVHLGAKPGSGRGGGRGWLQGFHTPALKQRSDTKNTVDWGVCGWRGSQTKANRVSGFKAHSVFAGFYP